MAKVRYAAPVAAVMGKLGRADEMSFRRHGRLGVYQKCEGKQRPATPDQLTVRAFGVQINALLAGLSVAKWERWKAYADEMNKRSRWAKKERTWREWFKYTSMIRGVYGFVVRGDAPIHSTINYARDPMGVIWVPGGSYWRFYCEQEAGVKATDRVTCEISRPRGSQMVVASKGDWRICQRPSQGSTGGNTGLGNQMGINLVNPYWEYVNGQWCWVRVSYFGSDFRPHKTVMRQIQIG